MKRLSIALALATVGLLAPFSSMSALSVLIAAGLGITASSALLGMALECFALHHGPRLGRSADALLGSSAELIVAATALGAGMSALAKASITGSILANLLLVLGLSAFLGGLRNGNQYFERERASHSSTLMVLSVIALGVPAFFGQRVAVRNAGPMETLSEAVAAVMIGIYLLSLYYHHHWDLPDGVLQTESGGQKPRWSRNLTHLLVPLSILLLIPLSRIFIAALAQAGEGLPPALSQAFVGLVIVPLIGNVAGHTSAIRAAWRNRMDLSVVIATDSSTQIALLVAPLLVFISLAIGKPMDLYFPGLQLGALAAAAAVATLVALDGITSWLEGAMLAAVYALIGMAFYWWPAVDLLQ